MILFAKGVVILFGVFLIAVGFLMLFLPDKARQYIRMAGSTPLINYAELLVRMIPAAAMVLASKDSKFPDVFLLFGWFMIITSLVLMVLPRKWHHAYAVMCADVLKPTYLRLISPLSMLGGGMVIYGIL